MSDQQSRVRNKPANSATARLDRACRHVVNEIAEFGGIVTGETVEALDAALCAAYQEGMDHDVHPFIVTRLRMTAQQHARASQMLAADKTVRNRAAGEPDALYLGATQEQTLEWKAADEIQRLRNQVTDLQARLDRPHASGPVNAYD